MLNVANSARLFCVDAYPPERWSCPFWKGDPDHVICCKGVCKQWDGKSPCASSDVLRFG